MLSSNRGPTDDEPRSDRWLLDENEDDTLLESRWMFDERPARLLEAHCLDEVGFGMLGKGR